MSPNPKVFISYSHSSEEYKRAVRRLAERLIEDGVDILIDQFELKEGQDLNSFMEKMLSDKSVERVLILSDKVYTGKANERLGGVGTETAIITSQVYEKTDQDKFIPVVMERDLNGNPYLPKYLSSRAYCDLTGKNYEKGYEQIVRAIYKEPAYRKPVMGEKPKWLKKAPEQKKTNVNKREAYNLDDGKVNYTDGGGIIGFEEDSKENKAKHSSIILICTVIGTIMSVLAVYIAFRQYYGQTTPKIGRPYSSETKTNQTEMKIETEEENSSVSDKEQSDSTETKGAGVFFEGFNTDDAVVYNAEEFSVSVEIKMAEMIIDGEKVEMGIVPNVSESVNVSLVDYSAEKVVETKTTYAGDSVRFTNISEGLYYYYVEKDGYIKSAPQTPFRLIEDVNIGKDLLTWSNCIEKEKIEYADPFSVKVVDIYGKELREKEIMVRVIERDNPNPTSFTSHRLYTNEDGFMTYWTRINGIDHFDIVNFIVAKEALLQIENENGEYQSVDADGSEICIITRE